MTVTRRERLSTSRNEGNRFDYKGLRGSDISLTSMEIHDLSFSSSFGATDRPDPLMERT